MFLFDHPANKKREEKGQYPINSIWFSGGGKKIKVDPNKQNKIVFSDLILLKKIAQLNLESVKIEPFTKCVNEKEDYYFIFNYNNNQIQIYYRLEQEHKNITFFSIRINYDNVLTYNSANHSIICSYFSITSS